MLDGILGRGFSAKCKSLIKLTKSRIDVIRRKRNATQKFLKKDMADLLANGLDINAYGRAEGLLVELTISSCYDFVENCCDFLYKHASTMQKQSECPEECREAVSSLMLAAARFSDLPELRDLRQIFQERYGNSLDHCLNRQFAEKLAPKPFVMEQKVHLMRDIASEFSISWNANNFEERMSKASAYEREHPKDNGFHHIADDKFKVPDTGKEVPPSGRNLSFRAVEASNNGQRFRKGQESDSLKKYELDLPAERDLSSSSQRVVHEREAPILRKDDTPRRGKQEFSSERRGKESADPKITRPDASFHRKVDEWADNGTKHSRGREKNVPDRDFRPGFEDNLPPSSSRSEVKVTSFFRTNGGSDHNGTNSAARVKSEGDRSYADHVAATSSKSEVKVTSYFHNCGGGDDSRANTLARVKSEGDRPYEDKFAATTSKCEVKVTSFLRSNGGFDHDIPNPVTRVKSEGDRPYFNSALPPPYVKPNVKAKDVGHRANSEIAPANPDYNGIPKSPSGHKSAGADQRIQDVQKGPVIGNHHAEGGKDQYKHRDEANGVPLPKARSSRSRHSKSRSAHDEARDHDEDAGSGKRSSRSRRRDDPRRGLQILFDDERHHKDEEEKIIDKLLIHYSKKPSTHEGERVKRRSRSRHHNNVEPEAPRGNPLSRRADTERPEPELGPVLPPRSVSLPREQPSAPPGPTKVFTRAATFQLDRSDDAAKHVHPKLPDYDDLAARFAALKGR